VNQERLYLWLQGQLPDEELTLGEVAWLEEAVFSAIEHRLAHTRPADFDTTPTTLQ
jgi:hypothetical protein